MTRSVKTKDEASTRIVCAITPSDTIASMDLVHVMFDADAIRAICTDVVTCLRMPVVQTRLFGGEAMEQQADPGDVIQRLCEMSANDVPLWELQWFLLNMIYTSDTVVSALRDGTVSSVFDPWYCGKTGGAGNLPSFRQRFGFCLCGQYEVKKKRGSRKRVLHEADTPLEIVVAEALLLHELQGMH